MLADTARRLHYCAIVIVIGALVFACVGFWSKRDLGFEVERAHAWDNQAKWQPAVCNVLAAGVACTEEDTRSVCGGYPAGHMPKSTPPVFKTEQIATCPGTYWCAKEGETCNCDGEVTYATHLFNGDGYVVPSTEGEFKFKSSGEVECGKNQAGQPFSKDPAPYFTKHCWCTPARILQILQQYEGTPLRKQRCAAAANSDFEHIARRLGGNGSEEDAAHRRLSARRRSHDTRRRRTLSYTPWALVHIPPADTEFDSESKGEVTCAYEFGAPEASYTEYRSDGTYAGAVWSVEEVAKKWATSTSAPCWRRAAGPSAACTVAMSKPGTLEAKRKGSLQFAHHMMLACFFVAFCGAVCWCGTRYQMHYGHDADPFE